MKKVLLSLFTFLITLEIYSQNPGSLDHSFNGTGCDTIDFHLKNSYPNSIVIQNDGKIIISGHSYIEVTSYNYSYNIGLARYNTDGTRDSLNFGQNGRVLFPLDDGEAFTLTPTPIALSNDGKIILSSNYVDTAFNVGTILLARLQHDGSIDSTFGKNGKVVLDTANNYYYGVTNLAIQSDNKILIVGIAIPDSSNYEDIAIMRFQPEGEIDSTFGTNGIVITRIRQSGENSWAKDVSILPDGKILIAAEVGHNTSDLAILRYNANGSIDSTFGTNGKTVTVTGFTENDIANMHILPNGKIFLTGVSGSSGSNLYDRFVRYDSTGVLDSSFGNGGIILFRGTPIYFSVFQNDGKIIIAKYSDSVCRFNENGIIDSTFIFERLPIPFSYYDISALALQPNGSLLIAGYYDWDFVIARYLGGNVGINEVTNENNILIFPNPATNNLAIETPSQSTINFSNIQGQLIKTLLTTSNKTNVDHVGYSSYVVDISTFPSGVYIVEVKTEKGVVVKKFVKE